MKKMDHSGFFVMTTKAAFLTFFTRCPVLSHWIYFLKIPQRLRKTESGPQSQSNRDAGEDLVPEQTDEVEETESRHGREQSYGAAAERRFRQRLSGLRGPPYALRTAILAPRALRRRVSAAGDQFRRLHALFSSSQSRTQFGLLKVKWWVSGKSSLYKIRVPRQRGEKRFFVCACRN